MPKLSDLIAQPQPKRMKLSDVHAISTSTADYHPDDVPYASGANPYTTADLMPAAMAPERDLTLGDVGHALGRDAAMQIGSLAKGAAGLPDILIAPGAALIDRGAQALGADPKYFSSGQNGLRGYVQAGLDAAGVPEPSTGVERFANRVVEGLGGLATGNAVGGVLAAGQSIPSQVVGKALTENLGQQAAALTAGNAAGGIAHEAGLSPAVELGLSLGGSITPAVLGAGYQGLTAAARRSLGTPDADTIALAKQAQEMGIPLKASQIGDSVAAKTFDSGTKNIPFSGGRAFQDAQSKAFNRAVSRTIGEDADKITPQVFDRARQRIGGEFDRLTDKNHLALTPELSESIRNVVANAQPFGQEAINTINGVVKDLVGRSQAGVLPGRAFQSIDSNLGKAIAAGGERAVYLGDLQEALRDAMAKNLSPEDASAWANARAQYKDLKTIEPLVAKAGRANGNISPGSLMDRVTANRAGKAAMARGSRGDLGDLAAIGQRFVKDPINNSGTAPRLAVLEALKAAAPTVGVGALATGAGALSGIGNAALTGLSAVATSRLAQRILQNPELVGTMLGNGSKLTGISRGVQASTQPGLLSLVGGLRGQ